MYNKRISRKMKSFIVWMLVAVLQLTSILPMTAIYAEGGIGQQSDGVGITTPGAIDVEIAGETQGFSLMEDGIKGEVDEDVIHTIEITVDGRALEDKIEFDNYRPKMGDEVDLKLKFTLPEDHSYGEGSTLTYTLPTPLKAASGGPGDLSNSEGDKFGEFKVEAGKVIITFNGEIRFSGADGGSEGLMTIGDFEIKAKFEPDQGNTGLEQDLTLPNGEIIKIEFQPSDGKVIEKTVEPENSGNASAFVEWTVNVNTVMDNLGNDGIDFTDTLTGNHKYNPGSLVVTRYELDIAGMRSNDLNVTSDYQGILRADEESFTLKLTGKYAYEVKYKTIPGDTDDGNQTLENNATFNDKSDPKLIIIQYGDP